MLPIGKTTGLLGTTSLPRNPSRSSASIQRNPSAKSHGWRWGLVPHWAKDASGSVRTINARSETAAEKPAFRDPMQCRRCLIPADAFYEWKRSGASKQPYCFEVNDGEMFAFAGLWDGWKDCSGNWLRTCTILTTMPNAVTSADPRPDACDPPQGRL